MIDIFHIRYVLVGKSLWAKKDAYYKPVLIWQIDKPPPGVEEYDYQEEESEPSEPMQVLISLLPIFHINRKLSMPR